MDACRKAEIDDLYRPDIVHIPKQDILELDVPVDNPLLVAVAQGGKNFCTNCGKLFFRAPALLFEILQQVALAELEYKKQECIVLVNLVQLDDVRVVLEN